MTRLVYLGLGCFDMPISLTASMRVTRKSCLVTFDLWFFLVTEPKIYSFVRLTYFKILPILKLFRKKLITFLTSLIPCIYRMEMNFVSYFSSKKIHEIPILSIYTIPMLLSSYFAILAKDVISDVEKIYFLSKNDTSPLQVTAIKRSLHSSFLKN